MAVAHHVENVTVPNHMIAPSPVTVVAVDLPFGSMVMLAIKWSLAIAIAALAFGLAGAVAYAVALAAGMV